jgi:hypothetical protein
MMLIASHPVEADLLNSWAEAAANNESAFQFLFLPLNLTTMRWTLYFDSID